MIGVPCTNMQATAQIARKTGNRTASGGRDVEVMLNTFGINRVGRRGLVGM
jgi:hypothetical protein